MEAGKQQRADLVLQVACAYPWKQTIKKYFKNNCLKTQTNQ